MIAFVSACGGGGAVTQSIPAPPSTAAANASMTTATSAYALANGTGLYPVPPLAGYGGTITLDTAAAPSGALLLIVSSLQVTAGSPPSSALRGQQNGSLNFLFFNTVSVSSSITVGRMQATYTLPNTIDPTGKQFFLAISDPTNNAALSFQTSGPAAISGQTLTFPAFDSPITLQPNVKYVLSVYYTTSTPVPSPSPSPSPVFLGYVSDITSYGFNANCDIVNFGALGCVPVTTTGATTTGTLAVGAYFQVFGTVQAPNVTASHVDFSLTPFPGSPTPPTGTGGFSFN
jgi:hypothetical protein